LSYVGFFVHHLENELLLSYQTISRCQGPQALRLILYRVLTDFKTGKAHLISDLIYGLTGSFPSPISTID